MFSSTKFKNWLKKSGLFTIKVSADPLIDSLRQQFDFRERSFFYGWRKYLANSLYCHASPGVLETILRELAGQKAAPAGLLNLGGGSGQVSSIFEFIGDKVSNVDIALDQENENDISWNLNQIPYPFADKSFDAIIAQEIIEHLENPWELFRQVKRILKPGGLFIVSMPNILSFRSRLKFLLTGYFPWFTPDCFAYHVHPIPFWQLEIIARQIGFQIKKLQGNGDYFFQSRQSNWKKILRKNEEIIISLKPQP